MFCPLFVDAITAIDCTSISISSLAKDAIVMSALVGKSCPLNISSLSSANLAPKLPLVINPFVATNVSHVIDYDIVLLMFD